MKCYFDNTKYFKDNLSKVKEIDEYDTLELDKVPEQFKISFICDNNPSVKHVRNVNDLYYIIINSISNIKTVYETIEDEEGRTFELGVDSITNAIDPILKYQFTKEDIEYIRNRRKQLMCNKQLSEIINIYSSLKKDEMKVYLEKYKVNCADLIIQSIYCSNKNKNNFIFDLLKICKTIDKYTLIFAVEEQLNSNIIEFLLNFYEKNARTCGGINIMNERGENVYNIMERMKTISKYKSILKNRRFNPPLYQKNIKDKLKYNLIVNGYPVDISTEFLIYMRVNKVNDFKNFLKKHPNMNINLRDKNDITPLLFAVYNNNDIEIVKILLNHPKIDVNLQDNLGNTALLEAVYKKRKEIVKLLLEHPKIDVNVQNDNDKDTALLIAVDDNNMEMVELLLRHPKINVNLQDKDKNTALIIATYRNNIEVVKLLLKHPKINVNLKGKNNETALATASGNNIKKIVELLLYKGADPNIPNKDYDTPLTFTSDKEIVKLLLKAGANPNIRNNTGQTALLIAFAEGNKEIIELLLNKKADPNILSKDFNTPLTYASEKGYTEIVKLLLKAGAIPNITGQYGNTALMWASDNGHIDIVKLLLKAGANPNIKNDDGQTALILASDNGHKEIVKLLISFK